MLEQAVSAFIPPLAKDNWFGTFTQNGWGDSWTNEERVAPMLANIWPGRYVKGHMGYQPEFAQAAYNVGVAVVFIYRDLRDVVVSQAHHILSVDGDKFKHPAPELYGDDLESALLKCITGIDGYPGVHERWAHYAGWLEDWPLSVKFEKLRYQPERYCKQLFRYCVRSDMAVRGINPLQVGLPDERKIVATMVERIANRKESVTFRRGETGGWREAFTPEITAAFKERDDGWLVRLGYEENEDW